MMKVKCFLHLLFIPLFAVPLFTIPTTVFQKNEINAMMETKQETPINPIMTQPSKHMNGFIASKLWQCMKSIHRRLFMNSSANTNAISFLSPLFAETYHIVNSDEPTACWVKGGECFLILDRKEFSQVCLRKKVFSPFVKSFCDSFFNPNPNP